MSASTSEKKIGDVQKYRFIVGISLPALEAELNRMTNDEPYLKLNQVLFVMGTGYVAILEHIESTENVQRPERVEQREDHKEKQQRSKKKP